MKKRRPPMWVQLLDHQIEMHKLNLDMLLKNDVYVKLKDDAKKLLLERRLVNFTDLQKFLKDCTYNDIEMLSDLCVFARVKNMKKYVTVRLGERLNILSNEKRRRELAL